jgi:hypothetical protein
MGPSIVGGVAFLAYLRTLMPGVAFGDWGEMQTVPHVLGVAHPTGYPTYVILAWLFELTPIGSVAFRANLLSAVLVSIALATTTVIAMRLGARPVVAVAAGLALGGVGTVWAAATVAEVNPLHLALIALIIHRALVWEERRRTLDLAIGGLLIGLALGNHLLTLFAAPFLVAFVLWVGRREVIARPWLLVVAAGALIVGLSVYLYIPIAASLDPPLPYNNPTSLESVIWLVSGTQFRGQFAFLGSKGPGEFVAALPALWDLMADRATPLFVVIGVSGLVILVRRRRAFGLCVVAILLFAVFIWANYLRLEHYLLVPWLILALGGAVAVEWLVETIMAFDRGRPAETAESDEALEAPRSDGAPESRRRASVGLILGAIAVVGALAIGISNWSAADRSDDRSGEDYLAAVFAALPADAAILSEWDASTPMWHGQHVRNERPDVLIVDDTNIVYEGWGTREARIASLICERPVFIIRLSDRDLVPTREAYGLSPFLRVRVAAGGPSAIIDRDIHRVEAGPGTCPP